MTEGFEPTPVTRRLALVYRGPASTRGCPEAVARLLRRSRWDLDVRFVGPREPLVVTDQLLRTSVLYAQPGGGDLRRAYRKLRKLAPSIRAYVESGGRYLGFCLGGYLAGRGPGFELLSGDTDRYITSRDASWHSARDTVMEVMWGGQSRPVYFQDGPWFDADEDAGTEVLARYDNALPAAVVSRVGAGMVGVVGPHPEATEDWFLEAGLSPPRTLALDLALELLDRVMAPRE